MPFYVADYLADTAHLSTIEHGAYVLLLMAYWRGGGLPSDERMLQRITRMTAREWARSRDVLAAFFDDGWKHKRVESELAKWRLRSNARVDAGKRGGDAKALKTKEVALANATNLPAEKPSQAVPSSSQPQSELAPLAERDARKRAFDRFWNAWPNRVGKPAAERSFAKVADELDAILAGVAAYVRDKPADRPWLNPATFLNQRRWEDAPASVALATRPAAAPRPSFIRTLQELDLGEPTDRPRFDIDLAPNHEPA